LHRGDHVVLAEAWDVAPPEMLGVLDPETAVARPVGLGNTVVDIEQDAIRPLANRVNYYLKTRGVGAADPGA